MGDSEVRHTAAAQLRLLSKEITAPASRRPQPARRTPPSQSSAPINLGILDHMAACRDELVTHTLEASPDAPAAPAEAADVYEWAYRETAYAARGMQRALDAMVLRQSWEHALALGDEKPVSAAVHWEACPTCGCWSLFWQSTRRIVACVNGRCDDELGLPTVWQLKQIAEVCVARRNAITAAAT
ncbi:hypothetical protein ACH4TX_42120 [Streptomyces sp. NPDC021098]|uniref:hypothetical protein n=1 Tax=unclassified Streptomyces TaxID=2593676 RepID=UPI0037B069F6